MTVTERVAYLKGLFDGLELDTEKKEGKMLKGILDALEDIAGSVVDLEQQNAELMDELDDVYEELSAIEEDFLDEDFDSDDDDLQLDEDEDLYQIICPTCSEVIYLDQEMLDEGETQCPACGEELEFDLSDLDEDENEDESKDE